MGFNPGLDGEEMVNPHTHTPRIHEKSNLAHTSLCLSHVLCFPWWSSNLVKSLERFLGKRGSACSAQFLWVAFSCSMFLSEHCVQPFLFRSCLDWTLGKFFVSNFDRAFGVGSWGWKERQENCVGGAAKKKRHSLSARSILTERRHDHC